MHELNDKIMLLDEYFIEVRESNYDFQGSFSINIDEAIQRATLTNEEELFFILDQMCKDPVIETKSGNRPLITKIRKKDREVTIYGCKTGYIEDHIKEIKIAKKREKAKEKRIIYIDKKYGIYTDKEKREPRYKIKSDYGRFKIIMALKKGKPIKGEKLFLVMKDGKTNDNLKSNYLVIVTNAINDMNKRIKKLKIDKDFIINPTSSGYTINIDDFDPKYL